VDGGRWTVDGGRWTVDGGRWTVDGGRCLRPPVDRTAHAAQPVAEVPGARAAVHRQPLVTVQIGRRARAHDLQDLAERRREVLGVARGRRARHLAHQRAVAGVGIGRRRARAGRARHAAQRVVDIARGAVTEQVAHRVIRPAAHLVGRVVAAPAVGAAARPVLGVTVAGSVSAMLVRRPSPSLMTNLVFRNRVASAWRKLNDTTLFLLPSGYS